MAHASESSPTKSQSASSPWILGKWVDWSLIIGSPLLIYVAIQAARGIWSPYAISSFVMIWAIGHHLPGMMRAYGDPELFHRFRVRFIVAPLLLMLACTYAYLTTINFGLLAIAATWGWWHYLMQTYGFLRIYDAKVGSFAPATRWLDKAMCLTWFLAAVVLNDNTLYGFVENFYYSGIAVPSPKFFSTLRSIVSGATAAITLMFFANVIRGAMKGHRPNWIKIVLMAVTYGFFWYSAATVTNILVAYAFFEIFHDIQYLTIVWAFNRNRVIKDRSLQGFTKFVFQPRVAFVGLYLLMIFGYGSLKFGSTQVSEVKLRRLLEAVFLTSTLLHYYFDGFIWKLSNKTNQTSLDIKGPNSAGMSFSMPTWLRHGLMWMLFVIPFGYLTVSQVIDSINRNELTLPARNERRVEETDRMVKAMPKSVRAFFEAGQVREATGDLDAAITHYNKAIEIFPKFEMAHEALARATQRNNAINE